MKNNHPIYSRTLLITLVAAVIFLLIGFSQEEDRTPVPEPEPEKRDELVILWSSGDKEVAEKMLLMYVENAMKYNWWDSVTVIVWGPSARLLSTDQHIRDEVKRMGELGVTFQACRACSDSYGVTVALEEAGLEVIYIGNELTEHLKSDRKVLTI